MRGAGELRQRATRIAARLEAQLAVDAGPAIDGVGARDAASASGPAPGLASSPDRVGKIDTNLPSTQFERRLGELTAYLTARSKQSVADVRARLENTFNKRQEALVRERKNLFDEIQRERSLRLQMQVRLEEALERLRQAEGEIKLLRQAAKDSASRTTVDGPPQPVDSSSKRKVESEAPARAGAQQASAQEGAAASDMRAWNAREIRKLLRLNAQLEARLQVQQTPTAAPARPRPSRPFPAAVQPPQTANTDQPVASPASPPARLVIGGQSVGAFRVVRPAAAGLTNDPREGKASDVKGGDSKNNQSRYSQMPTPDLVRTARSTLERSNVHVRHSEEAARAPVRLAPAGGGRAQALALQGHLSALNTDLENVQRLSDAMRCRGPVSGPGGDLVRSTRGQLDEQRALLASTAQLIRQTISISATSPPRRRGPVLGSPIVGTPTTALGRRARKLQGLEAKGSGSAEFAAETRPVRQNRTRRSPADKWRTATSLISSSGRSDE